MELGLLRYPYNYMNNRSLQELFPMMIEDQNINTIFNFEVSVSETKLYKKTEGILEWMNEWIVYLLLFKYIFRCRYENIVIF